MLSNQPYGMVSSARINSSRSSSKTFHTNWGSRSLFVKTRRSIAIGPQPRHKSRSQQHGEEKSRQRHCVSVCEIKSHSHQQSPKRARQHKHAKRISVGRTKRSQSKIPAQRVRYDVPLSSHSHSNQERWSQRNLSRCSEHQRRNARRRRQKKECCQPRRKKVVQQIPGANPRDH